MSDGRAGIDAALVRRLVAGQLPQWADLRVTPVDVDGWDNRTYRLGDRLTVRLATAAGYAPAVEKEDRWLPVLAPHLPLPVPVPVALGQPTAEYPFRWSVRPWLDGETARHGRVGDPVAFAEDVAGFLRALWSLDPAGGPAAGGHNFFRGCDPAHDDETRRALVSLGGRVDGTRAAAVWNEALAAAWHGPAVWFHGDVAEGNLLVRDWRLSAACDLVLAWTFLSGTSRRAFRDAVGQDDAAWERARGWAWWKALIKDLPLVAVLLED